MQEFIAADHIFKRFCEGNCDGQTMLASTLIPQPYTMTHASMEEDVNMSFGSMILHGLTSSETSGDLETCCRAASVLSHVLKDNMQCKERVLRIELESSSGLGDSEPLMHLMVKYLALASGTKHKEGKPNTSGNLYIQSFILKLLVTWVADCPPAVDCFLDLRPHLSYLLELVSDQSTTVSVRGLAAILLGECVIYNKSIEAGKDSHAVVDGISQKVGLTSYFLKFDEMKKSFLFSAEKSASSHKPLTRSPAASMADIEDVDEHQSSDQKSDDHPILSSMFDAKFVNFVKRLESEIRENIVDVYSRPKHQVAVVPAEMEQKSGESDKDYVKRLKSFLEKQCSEIQNLLGRNATLAEDLMKIGGGESSYSEQRVSTGSERVQTETLRRDLKEANQRTEMLKTEKAKLESEASMYQNLAGKVESDLKSLSDAYNSLEQVNFQLEKEVKALRSGGEQSKVEKLSTKLAELGEDVDQLLEGIGDDSGLPVDGEEDDEDAN
ncbi:Golgin candidate 6 [Linum perenne]